MKTTYQKRTGLLPPCTGFAPVKYEGVRLTIPAREALEAAGNTAALRGDYTYDVTLSGKVPANLVATSDEADGRACVRLSCEPPYPREFQNYWLQASWVPCPKCSHALIWYEENYVPGYRVCARRPYHHVLLGDISS